MKKLALLALVVCVGCGGLNPPKKADPVEVFGKVTLAGKPVSDVVLTLQPLSRGGQAALSIKDGSYKGSVFPGTYTYYLTEGRNPGAFRSIPAKYQSGAMDRKVDVSSGGALDLKFD